MPQVTIRAESCKGYPYVTAAHPENCIGCAICARMCQDAAIEVYK